MSFNIFAAGTHDFIYSRNHCADGDMFEAAAVISAMRAAGPTPVGVAEGLADYYLPSMESEARAGIQANLGTATRAHLADGVNLLASCNRAIEGWIAVSVNRERLLGMWPDATGFARYNFAPGAQPGSEFMHEVAPMLEATGMNNWGVLFEIDCALRHYYTHIHGRGVPMIQIQLSQG